MKKVFLISFLTSVLFITSCFTLSGFFRFKTNRTCRRVKSEVICEQKTDLINEAESLKIEESLPQPVQVSETKKKKSEKSRPKNQLGTPKIAPKQKKVKAVAPLAKPDEPQIEAPKNIPSQANQPVSKPSPTPITVEDKAHALFERCVDSSDKSLNWVNFCNEMSDILKQDLKKYDGLAQAFKDIATSRSIPYITYKLWWYTDKMPPKTKALYNKFSKSQLIHLINMRIALNDKPEKKSR